MKLSGIFYIWDSFRNSGIISEATNIWELDIFINVPNHDDKKQRTQHGALGNTSEYGFIGGDGFVYSDCLKTVCEEWLNPTANLSTNTDSLQFSQESFEVNTIESLAEIKVDSVDTESFFKLFRYIVEMIEKLAQALATSAETVLIVVVSSLFLQEVSYLGADNIFE